MQDDLVHINEDEELEINFEKLKSFADSFDRGSRSDMACDAKLMMFVWQDGFNASREEMMQAQQQMLLMFTGVGGSA